MGNIDEYRRGYEDGQNASIALTAMRSTTAIFNSDDYNRGYRHAQEGREFDPDSD